MMKKQYAVGCRLCENIAKPQASSIIHHLVFSILLFLLLTTSASAQLAKPPEFGGIRVGFSDRYKAGLWTPVTVQIRGGSERLTGIVSVTVPDGDGIPSQVVTPPSKHVQVLPGQLIDVRLFVRFGRVNGDLKAQFIVDGEVAAHKTYETALSAGENCFLEALEEQSLLVAVGDANLGLEEAAKLHDAVSNDPNRSNQAKTVIARLADIEQLPTHWYGYEGIDALVISTRNVEMFRKLTPDDARIKAIDEWIRMGGRLILSVGAEAPEVLAANSPFASFAPGRLESMVTRDQTSAWEQFSGGSMPMPQPKEGEKNAIICPKLIVSEGIEAREEDLPLVIRTPHGLGQILFVAADIDRPPFKNWSDRGLLMAKLLDFTVAHGNERQAEQYQGGYGYTDLSGQLRSSLDQFTGVKVVPFALVALMIVGYIMLIGPGDFFLLKKVLRRMEWTWFTFPIIVIAVSATAYWLAYYLKGNQLRVNQVDLVDVDVSIHTIRGTTWLNIFSPRMESFDLSLKPAALGKPAENKAAVENTAGYFAWFGLPGSGLGGMDPHGGNSSLLSKPYRLWPDSNLMPPGANLVEGVPIQVWSTKSFTGRWQTVAEVVPKADLSEEQQDLIGSITNPYDFPLENCLVAHRQWAYELGTIEPGKTMQLDTNLKRTDLNHYLTGYRMIKENKNIQRQEAAETTPFEIYKRDTSYILRTMMFYGAAGGRNYTHLANDYQSFVDLSNLLKTGRAILVADAVQNANETKQGAILFRKDTSLAHKGDSHTVIYRFVFPVKRK
jgi:hypothetical protein